MVKRACLWMYNTLNNQFNTLQKQYSQMINLKTVLSKFLGNTVLAKRFII